MKTKQIRGEDEPDNDPNPGQVMLPVTVAMLLVTENRPFEDRNIRVKG